MLEHAGRKKDAEKAYLNALLLNKDHIRLREKIGWIYYRNKQYHLAINHYSWLTRKSSSNPYYILMYAKTNMEMGNVQKALDLFKLAIEKEGGNYEKGWLELGDALMSIDKEKEGWQAYQNVLNLNPKNTNALGRIAKEEARKGDNKKALAIYHQALAIDPSAGLFLRRIGLIHMGLKNYPKAIRFFEKSLSKVKYPWRSHVLLGEAYTKFKDLPKALKQYELALIIKPRDNTVWMEYGKVHYLMKNYQSSLDAYHQSLQLADQEESIMRAEVHTNIAKVQIKQSNFELANQSLLTALELDSASYLARIQLSRLQYYHLEDKVQAIKEIKLALGLKPNSCQALNLANQYQLTEFKNSWISKCSK